MKVFWSWQDDSSPKENRFFIQDTLKEAVAVVGHDYAEADRPPELDHDTKGLSGSVAITDAILSKIRESAVFVADVTPIAETESGKALPNPNVLVELGWALQEPGPAQMILIMNTAHGHKPSDLPFDIRHRRIMTYKLAKSATGVERQQAKQQLKSNLVDAIKVNLETHSKITAERTTFQSIESGKDSSRWRSGDEISHSEFGQQMSATIDDSPRAYARLIPSGWRDGLTPTIHDVEQLPDNCKVEAQYIGVRDGSFGPCEEGFVRYSFAVNGATQKREVSSAAMFFDGTGEYWSLIGNICVNSGQYNQLDVRGVMLGWADFLTTANRAFSALGAHGLRKLELGIRGAKENKCIFPGLNERIIPRKEFAPLIIQQTIWDEAARLKILLNAYNRMRDCYGIPPATEQDILSMNIIRVNG